MLANYKLYMGGVDRGDQFSSYYLSNHRSTKWWKPIFISLLDTSIMNSFILYKSVSESDISQLIFREEIVYSIFFKFSNYSFIWKSITNYETIHSIGKREQRNCVVCSTSKNRKTTIYFCFQCNKNVHPECFHVLHIDKLNCKNKIHLIKWNLIIYFK